MSVHVAVEGADLVVRVAGDLDTATSDAPVLALTGALPTAAARVVVDLDAVTFLDSSGLGTLVRIRTLCHEAGVPLVLRGVGPRVSRMLGFVGLDTVFTVFPPAPASPEGCRPTQDG